MNIFKLKSLSTGEYVSTVQSCEYSIKYHIDAIISLSLIIATANRSKELQSLLASIVCSQYDLASIEVIIVDQNVTNMIEKYIYPFFCKLQIIYLKSRTLGLSHNRNIGLRYARGKYVGFPDDDCEYFPSTLNSLFNSFDSPEHPLVILGRIVDKDENTDIFRKWPKEKMHVNERSFYRLTSSITFFCKNNNISFDENFGLGAKYHANEDADLIFRLFKKKWMIIYDPSIKLFHPDTAKTPPSSIKAFNYGVGFGALCRKHLSIASIYLLFSALAFHLIQTFLSLLKGNFLLVRMRINAFCGRIIGFISYGH